MNIFIFKCGDRVRVISGFYRGTIARVTRVNDDGSKYMIKYGTTVSHASKIGTYMDIVTTETKPEIWINREDLLFIGEPKFSWSSLIIPILAVVSFIGITYLKFKSEKKSHK